MAVIVLIGGGVLAYSFSHGSGNSIAGDPPHRIIALATSAAQKAGSVHVVVSLQGPEQTASYVDDTASDSGSQVITSSGGVQVTTLVVGSTAYVKANQVGLANLFQSPIDIAQRFANQWLSFGQSSQAYKPIAQSVTLSSLLTEVTPTGLVSKLAPSIVDGQSVIGIGGELPGGLPGTLYVSASGSPLPVEEVSHTQSGTTTAIFSDWGSPVHIAAPSGAIPANTIPTLFGVSGSGNDQAAQANLTNALTEAKALYQSSQSYSPDRTAMTIGTFSSSAPEFAWTNGACTGATPANCVSMQVVDASSVGDGQGIILAVYSPTTQNCWYAVDLESPASSFTDTAPAMAFVTTGQVPTGASTPGVFYAKKSPSTVPSASTYCSAHWAATHGAFNWGLSYSSPGAA